MIIESGLIVAGGLLFAFLKCSWRTRMWMLSHTLIMDIIIFLILNALHWGTFSGVMVAATGSLVCSGLLSLGRWYFGYIQNNTYHRGVVSVHDRLSGGVK